MNTYKYKTNVRFVAYNDDEDQSIDSSKFDKQIKTEIQNALDELFHYMCYTALCQYDQSMKVLSYSTSVEFIDDVEVYTDFEIQSNLSDEELNDVLYRELKSIEYSYGYEFEKDDVGHWLQCTGFDYRK